MLRSILCMLLACAVARAADLHVPGDAPTIPAALALARDGDTIRVGPGTWGGPVEYGGKAVRIASDEGFGTTTIDGGRAQHAVVLDAASGTATLTGFTVVGGTIARVAIDSGNATLNRCRVLGGPGWGVLAAGFGAVTMNDCLVQGNLGGGVVCASGNFGHPRLLRCVLDGNGSPSVAQGGGVSGNRQAQLLDCIVSNNTARRGGGAADLGSLAGTLFVGNHATESGGGYWLFEYDDSASPPVLIEDAAFVGNTAPQYGGLHIPDPGFAFSLPVTVRGCLFAGNQDDGGDIGLRSAINTGPTTVDRCTFTDNALSSALDLVVTNTILRGSSPPIVGGQDVTVSWSDVQGDWPGTGNFDADPDFVDPDHDVLGLLPGSPCIDAGDPLAPPDPDGSRADVGALPLSPFAVARVPNFGLHGLPGLSGSGDLLPGSTLTLSLERARPGAGAVLVLGFTALHVPLEGGVLVPEPLLLFPGLVVGANGSLQLAATWPAGVPSGLAGWLQMWIPDGAADGGYAVSNGLGLVAP